MTSRNAGTTATPKSAAPDPISAELAAAPFLDGGLGDLMTRAGYAYLEEYVLSSDEGADHEPTEFERFLLEDFLNGLLCDEYMFGPVRRVLLQAAAAQGLFDAHQPSLLEGVAEEIAETHPAQAFILMKLAEHARVAIAKAVGTSEPGVRAISEQGNPATDAPKSPPTSLTGEG